MTFQPLVRELVVPLAVERAEDALRCYVDEGALIAASAICALPALGTQIALLRDVVATIAPLGAGAFCVRWHPADGGTFPRFFGTLDLRAHNGFARLRLDGLYEDPAAERGDVTEAEIAFRLAQAAARTMLETVVHRAFTEDSHRSTMLGA